MRHQIQFVNESNKEEFNDKVLTWLREDYRERVNPSNHFWHNRNIISDAFDECRAMVVLNDAEIIAYMIWRAEEDLRLEIDIVEVKKSYRRQGIFKAMLSALQEHFPQIAFLSAHPIPDSVKVFEGLGWTSNTYNRQKVFYKLLTPMLASSSELPDGRVVGIFSKADDSDSKEWVDFYRVQQSPKKYALKYFQIDLDEDGYLKSPIIFPFHYEGYIGLFLDKKLIAENKAKYLFNNLTTHSDLNLLALSKIEPCDPQALQEFMIRPESNVEAADQALESSDRDATHSSSGVAAVSGPPLKRARTELSDSFFQPPPPQKPESSKEPSDPPTP